MFKLALRNLWRNPKRSGITISAITIGIWALVFVWAFIDGMNEQMIVNNIQYLTGDLKIHQAGFHGDKELAVSLSSDDPVLEKALANESITVTTPRIEGPALISAAETSNVVMVYGVDPQQEKNLSAFDDAIVQGVFLTDDISEEEWNIVIGDNLARQLNAVVGSRVDLIVQAADGSLGADRFTVIGIYDTGIGTLDENIVLISLPGAQELYSLWGQYNSLLVRGEDRQQVANIKQHLLTELGDQYEVYQWEELLPTVVQSIVFHERVAYIVIFVIFTVVAAGIANTILMSVMERTREFGVMLALGTRSQQIIAMVLIEAMLLGLIGVIIGNVLGIGFTAYWSEAGLDLTRYGEAMETMPGLSAVIYPLIRQDHLLVISLVVFTICIIPALLPALRSSRLRPVEAIRGISSETAMAQRLEKHLPFPGGERARFLQLAWRNLFRNPKRSLLTAGTTGFGIAAFIFLYAFADGFFEQMINNSTKLLTSHVQVSAQGHESKNNVFVDEEQIEAALEAVSRDSSNAPGVAQAWAPRVKVEAMVSSTSKALPVEWYGIQPEREKTLTDIYQLLSEGEYLNESDTNSVIIGRDLAVELGGLETGNKLIVTLQSDEGELLSLVFRIKGIFDTGSELFNEGYIFTRDTTLRELLSITPDQHSHVAIKLSDRHQSQAFKLGLQQILSSESTDTSTSGWAVESWEDILTVVVQMVDMSQLDFYLILAIVFIVVAMGVMNTMLMSVLERTHEFGLLLALGTQPMQVLRTVIYEAIILGAIGVLLGVLLGVSIAQYYHLNGIDLSGLMDSMASIPGMTDRVFPTLIADNLIIPSLLLYLIGIVVSSYPARKAAYMKPVEALHHA